MRPYDAPVESSRGKRKSTHEPLVPEPPGTHHTYTMIQFISKFEVFGKVSSILAKLITARI
jgi:hypothetical protein